MDAKLHIDLDRAPRCHNLAESQRFMVGALGILSTVPSHHPRLIRSAEDAESAAAVWLRRFGFVDASTTNAGADGGIDVLGTGIVAQVKAEMKPTGRPVVQQIKGAASVTNAEAVVFSLAGFTDEAVEWALQANVALFRFDLQGDPQPANRAARVMANTDSVGQPQVDEFSPLPQNPATELETARSVHQLSLVAVASVRTQEMADAKLAELEAFEIVQDYLPALDQAGDAALSWLLCWRKAQAASRNSFDLAKRFAAADLPFMLEPVMGDIVTFLFDPVLGSIPDIADWETQQLLVHRRYSFVFGDGSVTLSTDDIPADDLDFIRENTSLLDGLVDE